MRNLGGGGWGVVVEGDLGKGRLGWGVEPHPGSCLLFGEECDGVYS